MNFFHKNPPERSITASLASVKQAAPGFYSYLAPGSQHEFYTTKVGDVSFADWVRKLVSDGRPGDVAPPR